jgi:membrane-associated phospholipid phosphatase
MLVWSVLIIISTVLTKQHYFLDVLGGLVLAFLSFKVAEIIIKKIDKSGRITQ